MHVLTVSDEIAPLVYSLSIKQRFNDVRLVLSCGDLPYSYLDFVVTMLGTPCVYVRGNHDGPEHTHDGLTLEDALGCVCAEDRCPYTSGLLIAGLGGSMRYNPNAHNQYTERAMTLRAWRLVPRLLFNRLRYGRYLDILLTHAPPLGIHDGSDLPHRGFRTFLHLMDRFAPRYLIHGHIHRSYDWKADTETRYGHTQVINTAGYRLLDIAPPTPETEPLFGIPAAGD